MNRKDQVFQTLTNNLLDDGLKDIRNNIETLNNILELIAQKFGYDSEEYINSIGKLTEVIPLNKIRQRYITAYMRHSPHYSHVSEQVRYMRFKQQLAEKGVHISPWNNDKSIDQAFANALDIPTPPILQHKIPFSEVVFKENIVLKPYYGSSSKNVYYYFDDKNIVKVKDGNQINGLESLSLMLPKTDIEGLWQVEGLICNENGKPANDIKIYSYYGKIGCILEIKRADKAYQCWYDENGQVLESERRKQPWFEGTGVEESVLEYAKKISLEIPSPFMRIDFYKGKSDYYLGELTPHPGRYFPEYSPYLDKVLGKLFCEAEALLFKDLLNNKQFSRYFDFYKT